VPESGGGVQKAQLLQTEQLGRFTRWMFEQVAPHVQGTVWEAGCGTGTYTAHLLAAGVPRILATDREDDFLSLARQRFAGDRRVSVFALDLAREDEFGRVEGQGVRSIVCLNVLEHIVDDRMVLRRMRALLPSGGRLLLLVPAHPALFNGIDESVQHCRRYTARDLRAKLTAAGFTIRRLYQWNALGIVGWFLYGHLLRRRAVPETPAAMFDRLVPLQRWAERVVLRGRLGVSLIAVCEV
jgi:SAM-dependent methyltransferase